MSRYELTKKYRCMDDCVYHGCPGHTATFTYQTNSDTVTFNLGRGRSPDLDEFHGFTWDLEILVDFMREVGLLDDH